ncbi:MAG: glycosyltransferase family 2 protein [Noviherbaspirillum sp.]
MTKILAFNRNRKDPGTDPDSRQARGVAALRRRTGISAPGSAEIRVLRPAAATIVVSIVVPTRNRPQLLSRCLGSLVSQRFDAAHFEIIIVDDGPDNATRDVVAGWTAHTAACGPRITYIPSMGPHGPAAARNHGWRAARGAIVAFTDDDTIARTDWLRNGVHAFGDEVHAVSGRVVMPLSATPTAHELQAKTIESAEFVTANCFCRKKVLEDLGGFDERFRFAWREDADLHFRLLDYHARIAYEPKAVMMHPVRPAAWGDSLVQLKKTQFDALLFKKHPARYRRRIRAQPRRDFYLTVGALLTMLVALAAGATGTALIAGLTWLFMTGRFCAQRLKSTSKSPGHIAEMVVTSILIPPLAVYWRAVGAVRFRVGFM